MEGFRLKSMRLRGLGGRFFVTALVKWIALGELVKSSLKIFG